MTSELIQQIDQVLRNYMVIGGIAYIVLPILRALLNLAVSYITMSLISTKQGE